MHQLHFKAEVRDLKDLGIEPAPVSEPELKLAQQLIDHLAAKQFDPNEFSDEHKARVEAAIQKKIEGKEVSLAEGPVSGQGRQCHRLDGGLESKHRCARIKDHRSQGTQGAEAGGEPKDPRANPLDDEMHAYDTKDLERLFGLPASAVRSLARAGHLTPVRRAGRLHYSFQDLIVLRTASALRAANIPVSAHQPHAAKTSRGHFPPAPR